MAAGYQDCPRDWSRASRANHNHFPCICHHRHGNSLADRASGRRERSHWLVLCLLKEKGLSVTERRTRSTRHLPQCFALYAGGVSADVKPWCCLQVWRGKSETCGRGQFLLQTLCFACQEQLIFFFHESVSGRVVLAASRWNVTSLERREKRHKLSCNDLFAKYSTISIIYSLFGDIFLKRKRSQLLKREYFLYSLN